jgi:hypothetical protein
MSRALDRIVVVEELTSKTSQQLQTDNEEALKRDTDVLALQNIEEVLPVEADPEEDIEEVEAVAPVDGVFEIYPCVQVPNAMELLYDCTYKGVRITPYDGKHVYKATIEYTQDATVKTITGYFYPSHTDPNSYTSYLCADIIRQTIFKLHAADFSGPLTFAISTLSDAEVTISNATITKLDLVVVREPAEGTLKFLPYTVITELEKYYVSKSFNNAIRFTTLYAEPKA